MSAVDLPEIEVVLLTDATVVFDLDLTGDKSIGINQGELHPCDSMFPQHTQLKLELHGQLS